jgi:hypothetical protein
MQVNVIRLLVDMGESSGMSSLEQSVQDSFNIKLSVYKHW